MSAPTRRSTRSMNTQTSPYFSTQTSIGGDDEKIDNSQAQAKRKAKLSPTSKTNNKKKSKSESPVKRTQSFEPAWWGNVLVSDDSKNLHSHVAASAAAATSTPTKSDIEVQKSYPPVHTLILGTHPSIASLDKNEMFGHPLNAFWYLAGDALGFRRSEAISPTTKKPYKNLYEHLRYDTNQILEYPQQLEKMVSKGFAMWDIVASCEREGSLDTDIEQEVANPIREFCEGSEHLGGGIKRIVIANGTTGAKYFVKHFTDWFVDGKLCAANDEMSQRVFKTVMNKARKANNGSSFDDAIDNGNLIKVVCLPGVSPAAAKFTYLEKRDAWEKGCYGPGLEDYEAWKQSMEVSETTKRYVTPAKQTKSKTPKKSPTRSPSRAPTIRIVSSDLISLAPENEWVDLEIPAQELRPSATLTNGQCFNWIVVETELESTGPTASQSPQKSAWGTHDAKEWVGPLGHRVLSIQEMPTTTRFRVLYGDTNGAKEDLQRYFRLETPLAPLYKEWSAQDKRLAKIAKAIPGVRILRQDPLECMFSFICSSNNNIPRITQMLSFFRSEYGTLMMKIPTRQETSEESSAPLFLYAFPTLSSLMDATEDNLRSNGFGYRAKYIIETRNLLEERGGNDFLLKLREQQNPVIVQEELTKFSGIGRKVADCIALFSLDQDDSIPVDVHVQQIAGRDYDPTVLGAAKSLTPTIYKRIGDLFRDRFKTKSGWAHSLLFVAELPSFRNVLPQDVVREMDEWRDHEKQKKREMKEEIRSKKAKVTSITE